MRELPSRFDLRHHLPRPQGKGRLHQEAKDKLTSKLPPLPPPLHYANMKPGAVGELTFGELSGYGGAPFIEVVQVIDKGKMIVRFERDSLLWVEHDTTGLVDDQLVGMADICWQVIGTKTYRMTVGATKTVFHLGPSRLTRRDIGGESRKDPWFRFHSTDLSRVLPACLRSRRHRNHSDV